MDIRINTLESTVHLSDARAMVTPEVLAEIVAAVVAHLRAEQQLERDRDQDMNIGRHTDGRD